MPEACSNTVRRFPIAFSPARGPRAKSRPPDLVQVPQAVDGEQGRDFAVRRILQGGFSRFRKGVDMQELRPEGPEFIFSWRPPARETWTPSAVEDRLPSQRRRFPSWMASSQPSSGMAMRTRWPMRSRPSAKTAHMDRHVCIHRGVRIGNQCDFQVNLLQTAPIGRFSGIEGYGAVHRAA